MTGAVEKQKDASRPTMKVDIVYFSRSGNTRRLVEILGRELAHHAQVRVIEIQPKRNYPYLVWLLLSFIPRLGVSMRCEESTAPVVFLCLPKWTFNCPPLTSFVRRGDLRGKTVAVAISCGGFDERRFAEDFLSRLDACGCTAIKDVLLVKRERIDYEAERIRSWVRGVIAPG